MELTVYKKKWKPRRVGDNMDRHLDFDDIVDYINCRELSEKTIILAQQVNSHILKCDECRRMYNATLAFYDFAFDNSLGENLFGSFENIKMLVKFKVSEKINIILDRLSKMVYQYDYPIPVGARAIGSSQNATCNKLVDEDNGLNTIVINNDMCKIEIDKEDWGETAPIVFVKDAKDQVIFSGVMNTDTDVYFVNVPVKPEEYAVYIASEGF